MLEQKVRMRLKKAMKDRDESAKGILRLVASDMDMILNSDNQKGKPISDDQATKIMMRRLGQCQEQLARTKDDENVIRQKDVLCEILPKIMDREEIAAFLYIRPACSEICRVPKEGAAIGIAMRDLNSYDWGKDCIFPGDEVKAAVQQLRKTKQEGT